MNGSLYKLQNNLSDQLKNFNFQNYLTEDLMDLVVRKGLLIVGGIFVLILGFYLSGYLVRLLRKTMRKGNLDPSLVSFLGSASSITIKVLVIISVAAMLGVETSAFVTVIGAAGLAIGLALQGSLSNFAGGVLILVFKPFKVGDLIESNGETGVVERIEILYTKITDFDNKVIIAPNGDLANSTPMNYSEKPLRRVEIPIRLSYKSDIKVARQLMLDVFKKDKRIAREPQPVVKMVTMEESYVNLSARAWCSMDDFYNVYWDSIENIKYELEANEHTDIPFPQRDIYIKDN
ncbi:MAG: mechanosensitive ion channel [Owenweeksia sp.]|nr:mechanosensitive ion channel [Owenweeksia sp.]